MIRKFIFMVVFLTFSQTALSEQPDKEHKGWLEDEKAGCLYVEGESEKKYQERLLREKNARNDDLMAILIHADLDGDNKISIEEAVKANIQSQFIELDGNRNKFIEPFEVNLWLKYGLVEKIWDDFHRLDKDQNGQLDDLETMVYAKPIYNKFQIIDKNKDEAINLDEYAQAIQSQHYKEKWFKNYLKIVKDRGSSSKWQ